MSLLHVTDQRVHCRKNESMTVGHLEDLGFHQLDDGLNCQQLHVDHLAVVLLSIILAAAKSVSENTFSLNVQSLHTSNP